MHVKFAKNDNLTPKVFLLKSHLWISNNAEFYANSKFIDKGKTNVLTQTYIDVETVEDSPSL